MEPRQSAISSPVARPIPGCSSRSDTIEWCIGSGWLWKGHSAEFMGVEISRLAEVGVIDKERMMKMLAHQYSCVGAAVRRTGK